jgi:hypothetical protein
MLSDLQISFSLLVGHPSLISIQVDLIHKVGQGLSTCEHVF